jgi:hypothetical protein
VLTVNGGSRTNGSPFSATSAPTPYLNERHGLWTSLNGMDCQDLGLGEAAGPYSSVKSLQ